MEIPRLTLFALWTKKYVHKTVKRSNTVSLSTNNFYMYMMHNSVCITSVNFILLGPVVQEKIVKTHREGKNCIILLSKFGALYVSQFIVRGTKMCMVVQPQPAQ